jgi:hypothetical protein
MATASRLLTFVIPVIFISTLPGHRIDHVWFVSVASTWLQACISFLLLRRTMRLRLAT